MLIEEQYAEALRVAERLGTWVLYFVRDATSLEKAVGYLAYTAEDLERLRDRAGDERRRASLGTAAANWRRATRWVAGLDDEQYAELAERFLERIDAHPHHRELPYVQAGSWHRALAQSDEPPRRAGRPRVRPVQPTTAAECGQCGGLGFVER